MPRLAPVTSATLRSGIGDLLTARPEPLHVAPRDAPSVRTTHQLVVVAYAHRATSPVGEPVLRGAVGAAPGGVAVDVDGQRGDGVARGAVAPHGLVQCGQGIGDGAAGERAAIVG